MIIKELLRRGTNHKHFCKDSIFSHESNNITYLAVFDGCSTGIKSHFASELMSKLFRKSINQFQNSEHSKLNISSEEILKNIFYYLFFNFQTSKMILEIPVDEILSTMVLAIVKKNTTGGSSDGFKTVEYVYEYDLSIAMSGDGAFFINNKLEIVDSVENKPDYLAYHLNDGVADAWKSFKTYDYTLDNINNFAIMSDGITSFKKLNLESNFNSLLTDDEYNFLIDKLLVDETLLKSDAMLARKMNILEKKGYNHFDDLSIIRIVND